MNRIVPVQPSGSTRQVILVKLRTGFTDVVNAAATAIINPRDKLKVQYRKAFKIMSDEAQRTPEIRTENYAFIPSPGKVYVHYENGDSYGVEAVGFFKNNLKPCVVYRSVSTRIVWVTSLESFTEAISVDAEGNHTFRFMPNLPPKPEPDVKAPEKVTAIESEEVKPIAPNKPSK